MLCYHGVDSQLSSASSLFISEHSLEVQLAYLRRRGYVGLTLRDAELRRRQNRLPRRTAVITFDDGFASVLEVKPVLDRYGFPATVFVVTRFADSGEPLCWPGIEMWIGAGYRREMRSLTWAELDTLAASGWEIGSHTLTHPRLSSLDVDTRRHELKESRRLIAERFGECQTLAYPYGYATTNDAAATMEAGYLTACTLSRSHQIDEPYRRPRLGMSEADRGFRLAVKLSSLYGGVRRSPLIKLRPAPKSEPLTHFGLELDSQ